MPYGKRLQKFWDSLPENEKEKIKRESEALRTEYNSLQEIRRELELSQQDVANSMGVKQVSISKLESRDDMKISTLKEYCEAMGAKVKIVVVIKNKEFELNAFNHTDKQFEIIYKYNSPINLLETERPSLSRRENFVQTDFKLSFSRIILKIFPHFWICTVYITSLHPSSHKRSVGIFNN